MRNHVIAAALLIACACGAGRNEADSAAVRPPSETAGGVPPTTTDSTRMSDSITVRTDKQSYRPGETVKLTIVNASAGRYTYNPCTRIVERDSSGTWTAVREDRMCTMIAHLLEPKQTRIEQTEMADGIAPGRYRLVLSFSSDDPANAGGSVRAATGTLTVAR